MQKYKECVCPCIDGCYFVENSTLGLASSSLLLFKQNYSRQRTALCKQGKVEIFTSPNFVLMRAARGNYIIPSIGLHIWHGPEAISRCQDSFHRGIGQEQV